MTLVSLAQPVAPGILVVWKGDRGLNRERGAKASRCCYELCPAGMATWASVTLRSHRRVTSRAGITSLITVYR